MLIAERKAPKMFEIIFAQRVRNNLSFTTLQSCRMPFYKGQRGNYTPKNILCKLLTFQTTIKIFIKGSLDAKVPSYEVLKMRENRCLENRCLEKRCLENRCLENRCSE